MRPCLPGWAAATAMPLSASVFDWISVSMLSPAFEVEYPTAMKPATCAHMPSALPREPSIDDWLMTRASSLRASNGTRAAVIA